MERAKPVEKWRMLQQEAFVVVRVTGGWQWKLW